MAHSLKGNWTIYAALGAGSVVLYCKHVQWLVSCILEKHMLAFPLSDELVELQHGGIRQQFGICDNQH